jgi:Tfp pilus assembly protein PilV
MKKGFTLAEVAVASVIILVVLSALAVALAAFVRGNRSLELQSGALTLARVEISGIENAGMVPAPGVQTRADSLWGNPYTVETAVLRTDEHISDVTVSVSSGDSISVNITRRFYE